MGLRVTLTGSYYKDEHHALIGQSYKLPLKIKKLIKKQQYNSEAHHYDSL